MENNASESGVLKRKHEEGGVETTKESEFNSPPAKIPVTEEKRSEHDLSKANVVDMVSTTSTSNQTISAESSGETYGEREKMQ